MQSEPRITLVICTYNRAAYLKDTLQDLAAQDAPAGLFEILVVNNNSEDETELVSRQFGEENPGLAFRMVTEREKGLSHARNRAVSEAAAPVIHYIDDDVYLPDKYITTVLKYLEMFPEARCAGGRIRVSFDSEGKKDRLAWIPSELMPMFGLHELGEKPRIYPPGDFPRGGNMLIFKSVFQKYGAFDVRLGRTGKKLLGSEEKAFFERVRENGVKLYYWPEMELTHRIGATRLKKEYLRRQSEGIGESEGLRVKGSWTETSIKGASEVGKAAVSLLLSLLYLLKGKPYAAGFLLKFRYWVFIGFVRGAFGNTERSD
ncbi:MAG TPA: glycosyltransferase [Balneolaceae bacterium]|nr:glycosyltransferase [Balneolaceae bacterium]